MMKEDVILLLNMKIKDAIEIAELDDFKRDDAWSHYYYGVAEGLRKAKSIIGMIDKNNKISK